MRPPAGGLFCFCCSKVECEDWKGERAVLDIRLIRERPEEVERALAQKGGAELVKEIAARDAERRRLIRESEELKALHGRASQEMGRKFPGGAIPAEVREEMRIQSDRIKSLDVQ